MISSQDGSGRQFADSINAGEQYELGSYLVTEADIIEFASRWDPQEFHVDPIAAGAGHFAGIIASGVHTLAIFQRLAVETVYRQWAVIGGRRLSQIEFLSPVRPGMTLVGAMLVQEIKPENPTRSLATVYGTLTSAEDTVFSIILDVYLARRVDS